MAIVSIRMDDEVKKKFEIFCDSIGISVSAAVNMFARMALREDRLPFDVKGSSAENITENQKTAL